jgi:hypothetical protein
MTKKDYIKASEIIKFHDGSPAIKEILMSAFVELFRGDNPRFDVQRFLLACDPKKVKK